VLERKKRRLPCEIRFRSQRFNGVVIGVSASGVFIQTGAKFKPGDSLALEVGVPGRDVAIPLAVDVVRQKRVPARLLTVAQGGIGARIRSAHEAFYEYLLSLDPIVAESKCRAPRGFQVWARQLGSPRTKRLFFAADDPGNARQIASEHLGDGWEILDSSEVQA